MGKNYVVDIQLLPSHASLPIVKNQPHGFKGFLD